MTFKFEQLTVWQKSAELATRVHQIAKTFPASERYVLSQQAQRAADSVSLNIAEGSTGQTTAEFKQFLGYAIRSGVEVVGCLHLAKKRQLISEAHFQELYEDAEVVVKMIQALRKSLR